MRALSSAFSIALLCAAGPAMASMCMVQSPPNRVALVELYTSQGCSSCPPADRWLSTLHLHYRPSEAIPLALHVGYWDYIGWKDPFARPEFNERQRKWASANQSRTVYTPGVFVDGRELRQWSAVANLQRQIKLTNATAAGANITVVGRRAGDRLHLELTAKTSAPTPGAELRVALLQSGLNTAVGAGENRGEKLNGVDRLPWARIA
jgi:hypothetical protein